MQMIIDEIVSNIRAIEREAMLPAEVTRQIIDSCVRAVQDWMAHDQRAKEERSVGGPGALEPGRDW